MARAESHSGGIGAAHDTDGAEADLTWVMR